MTLRTIMLFGLMTMFISCKGQGQKSIGNTTELTSSAVVGDTVSEIGKNIRAIFQDSKNNYWYGSDGEGVYRYDGKVAVRFTDKHGLSHNQIRTIQEDNAGNIWFETGDGVSRFDGRTFVTMAKGAGARSEINVDADWKAEPNDLWFAGYRGGVYRWDGKSMEHLQFPRTPLDSEYYARFPGNSISPYSVYCIYKDSKGNLWFGTEYLGVCRYDGKSFTWFMEDGLGGTAVRAVYEDKSGNFWFGTSAVGLFRYDGKDLTNFTEEKGLSNPDILKALKDRKSRSTKATAREGTLSSIVTINGDSNGEMWVGTFEAGVWRYDGENLTNYTVKDGLPGNAVMAVYKDRKGELMIGTEQGGVYTFNGNTFVKSPVQ